MMDLDKIATFRFTFFVKLWKAISLRSDGIVRPDFDRFSMGFDSLVLGYRCMLPVVVY